MTAEEAKAAIETAEFNCSGEHVEYNIDKIIALSEEGAYLIFASCKGNGINNVDVATSFIGYDGGEFFFLRDWHSAYPKSEEEIVKFDWVTIDWRETPIVANGLPRIFTW